MVKNIVSGNWFHFGQENWQSQKLAARPIRAVYKSASQLRELANEMAGHEPIALPEYDPFIFGARLSEDSKIILYVFRATDAAARNNETVTPAAQWLLDNHYTIDKAIQQTRRDFPRGFLKQLPAYGDNDKIARIFAMAWLYVAHTDSNFSLETLTEMVEGYQEKEPLRIGELWALPSAIRFLLIDNARRLCLRIEKARQMRFNANEVADKIIAMGEEDDVNELFAGYREFLGDTSFAAHLLNRLRGASVDCSRALTLIDDELSRQNIDSETIMVNEHSRQATGGVTMGNVIKSLKAIDDVDWTSWFESVSHVDFLLRNNSDFSQVDFHSRNNYRRIIEKLARRSPNDELTVTRKALELADETRSEENVKANPAIRSLAWFLVGEGRSGLEKRCDYEPTFNDKFMRFFKGLGIWNIAVPVTILTLVLLAIVYCCLHLLGLPQSFALLFTAFAIFPSMDIASALYNLLISWTVEPNRLIGYEYKDGIPEDARTLVVVPTMINSRDSVDEQVRNLEVHYLNNPNGAIGFVLLSDWPDAKEEETKEDLDLLDYARDAIAKLNHHYFGDNVPQFFILHRRRLYNKSEGCFMGWERKRGKLHELNLLLRGDQDTSFFPVDPNLPRNVRYIMTLDSDTRLTPDSVTLMVGKLSHPINRPVHDPKTNNVIAGYGILQPRVTPSLTTGEEASFLQRVFSLNRGIDPYVFAVSDTYQDLLGEGSFTGKGLYDIDAFERAMDGRIDENAVLSHDLLEGGYARAALVTDVEVIEDYPTAYQVDAARHHRWVRGDWQLLPYLFKNRGISLITRWKMQDNLRRSLTPLLWCAASIAGWCLMPLSIALIWQAFLLIGMFIAPTLGVLRNMLSINRDYSIRGHLQAVITSISSNTAEATLRLTFIAHTAYYMVDAIIRTLYRLGISHQNLLEWRSSAATKSGPNTLISYIGLMWPASIIGLIAIALPIILTAPAALLALPFGFVWFFSPFIAWIVSRSAAVQDSLELHASDKAELRRIARRTWLYYETFANEENNFLPPDNFQEEPEPIVAKRTSPTNIGVYLLAIVSARDFGWISFSDTLRRLELSLATLDKLEKYQGHLYNWYETDSLRPLLPLYVSTVDSGNLAGHLVTLSSALRSWAEAPAVYVQTDFAGLNDVNDIIEEALAEIPNDRRVLRPLRARIFERTQNFRRAVFQLLSEPETATFRIHDISLMASDIAKLVRELDNELHSSRSAQALAWAERLLDTCAAHELDITGDHDSDFLRAHLLRLAEQARQYAFDMKFDFLERKERRLLSIGYRVQENELDESCYDLLASEARLSSLFAIAKGDLKVEHWFRLGRLLVPVGWKGALLSWSGSMFEYLMPPLVMREPLGSLLDQTNRLVVREQIRYARERSLPWGISEAAFNARDQQMNYQYGPFGVPSLGLKRGLSRNAVIAPYASLLAAQYSPSEAVSNLRNLRKIGALGQYGFYDAVDFTPARVPEGKHCAIVHNYYAHHHGMSILAISNVIFDGIMRERFHSDPVIEATELLLQEKAPREIPVVHAKTANPMRSDAGGFEDAPMRIINDPLAAARETLLLSNGSYNVMLTSKGAGYSRWNDVMVTRFEADSAQDQQGTFLFLRDVSTGRWWSATSEPTRVSEEDCLCVFTAEKAEYHKTVDGIKSTVEVIVASEGDGEGRRIELINTTGKDRIIEITSYGELVLTTADNDAAHPVFSRMFVETEIADDGATIFAHRRKRSPNDRDIYVSHFVTDAAGAIREAEAETDRAAFIGRGRTIWRPIIFDRDKTFAGSSGCVLDPIAAIRCKVRVPAHKKIDLVFWTLVADNREKLDNNIAYYRQPNAFPREFAVAWTRSQVTLYQVGITPKQALDFQKYAGYLIYPERPWLPSERIATGLGKQSDLWPMSISGDYPIFVLRISNETDIGILQSLLRAHEFWRTRGLIVDCVVLNERAFSYAQDTQRAIDWMCEGYRNRSNDSNGKPHIFTIRRDQISDASFDTLLSSARIVLHAANGTLAEQLKRMESIANDPSNGKLSNSIGNDKALGKSTPHNSLIIANTSDEASLIDKEANIKPKATAIGLISKVDDRRFANGKDLQFWNNYGGFDTDGSYVTRLIGANTTPHPWINVISNEHFGMHVSSEGSSFTWAGNSRDYQLTRWANDPVSNRPGEALYIVDRDSLRSFSPVSAVERDHNVVYEARHGQGYSQFSSTHDKVDYQLTHIVDPVNPVKLSRLTIKNNSTTKKRLRLYHYTEWVLGSVRAKNAPFIVPTHDKARGALFVRNPYQTEKADLASFVAASIKPSSVSADRNEFIGPLGVIEHPQAIRDAKDLSNRVEAGLDPCSALAIDIEIAPSETKEVIFYLGNGNNIDQAKVVLDEAKKSNFADLLAKQKQFWRDFTAPLQVKTPDPSFDLMVNHWLPYQAYACRIMARAAFYQASGAFGFRDQLQDTLSMLLLEPNLASEQLINAASRQFKEGDVQHWWLPQSGSGVRTLISDDVVWLGYGVSLYVKVTGNSDILDQKIAFIEGELLNEGQHDSYFTPERSGLSVSLYDHCALALDLAIKRTGENGLPLMLGGDWNDGMNLVGVEGKGESVWLGWFLCATLQQFIPLAKARGDEAHVNAWNSHIEHLTKALHDNAWDGEWYRRGFYDNGAPLGSHLSDECKIDTIAQSWSVLSGVAASDRQEQAMASMLEHLLDEEGGLIRLFWPPFDKTVQEPGYIKGYPPGVRENGGQYTHGALWSILALAKMGKADDAYKVFSMVNPISHGQKPEIYKVEPYAIAADIYSVEPWRGQGGWTWYTGSAGWFYRAATEAILGIRKEADRLYINPSIPSDWKQFKIDYKNGDAIYHITVTPKGSELKIRVNDEEIAVDEGLQLEENGEFTVNVTIPKP
ncbi:protein ndvB [Bartonella sp. HY329]|uniref:GH36-type glycosyl hydrolase domain-containing protein n=1 Tax=unclassified Bartonella TaxID=2645622 RepID=UPI0021C6F1A5|nr:MULTISPECIES: glucoamylase family protein [unclassified Bartonella]UXM95176.1 protein ndvB [Bartonella sp. HY329]UXN09499.1 protein ndvB [Bartonella sp. HY328]